MAELSAQVVQAKEEERTGGQHMGGWAGGTAANHRLSAGSVPAAESRSRASASSPRQRGLPRSLPPRRVTTNQTTAGTLHDMTSELRRRCQKVLLTLSAASPVPKSDHALPLSTGEAVSDTLHSSTQKAGPSDISLSPETLSAWGAGGALGICGGNRCCTPQSQQIHITPKGV